MNNRAYDKLLREEGTDPHEEATRLRALFAQMERVVAGIKGMTFYHLEPGTVGKFSRRLEWNAYLYLREQDQVFPFKVSVETGKTSQFNLRVHPDMEEPTDFTVRSWLQDIIRQQLTAGVDGMCLRMRYWTEHSEEPIAPVTASRRAS